MAHGHREQNRQIDIEQSLGTMGAEAALQTDVLPITNETGSKLLKLKMAIGWRGKQTDEGPISVGIAIGLSVTQIKEAMEAAPTSLEAEEAVERANRKVFVIGIIPRDSIGSNIANELNPLKTITDLPKWEVPEGTALTLFAFNHMAAALTGGVVIEWHGWLRTRWMKD